MLGLIKSMRITGRKCLFLLAPSSRFFSKTLTDSFRQSRETDLQALADAGKPLYPSLSTNDSRLPIKDLLHKFSGFQPSQKDPSITISTAGRITARREMGSKLLFFDIKQGGEQLQVFVSKPNFQKEEDFEIVKNNLQIGDIIEVHGFPGRTGKGEMSIYSSGIALLAPTLHPIPFKSGIHDSAIRARMRFLDLLVNEESSLRFKKRAKIISRLRHFLDSRGFLEVETPVLFPSVGGAAATPFKTKANAIDTEMSLRISPELQLKQLVIGGLDRVYEIGKQFRNEGIDRTHNPEFTTCEFYQAYANFESLIKTTEELLADLVQSVNGSLVVNVPILIEDESYPEGGQIVQHEINFTPPFRIIEFLPEIEKHLGIQLPPLDTLQAPQILVQIMAERGISTPEPHTTSKLLDHLSSIYLEPQCIQPTFLVGHPKSMSPLAKEHPTQEQATARFELFVAGKELVNAYSELNDPNEQRKRFEQQAQDKLRGDVEAQVFDEEFCKSLEYGLPPTAGWGMGVDRLCMFLTGTTQIRDVLFFPMVKSRSL